MDEDHSQTEAIDLGYLTEALKKLEANIVTYKTMLADAGSCKSDITRQALVKVCAAYWNKWFKN